MAGVRSKGLVQVTVTVLDKASEPRDHKIPLIKQKESLPDYEILVNLNNGQQVSLGAKPDTSAADGLTWSLSDPVSLAEIASVRLQEQDKVVSDAIAEVQVTGEPVTQKGYRFDFRCERSASVGIRSFFSTPIGKAIAAGFCIAVLLMLLSMFSV